MVYNLIPDRHLTYLIQALHQNSIMQDRRNRKGSRTDDIIMNKGVRQGCILAPTLCNICLDDLETTLLQVDDHWPSLTRSKICALLYANDEVLLSWIRLGLKHLLEPLVKYCQDNQLQINYAKTKILSMEIICLQAKHSSGSTQ